MTEAEEKRALFKKLHDEGLSYSEIAKQCNSTKSLVAYYLGTKWQKNQEKIIERAKAKEEYENIIVNLISKCNNINDVCKNLGLKGTNTEYTRIRKIIEKYHIDTSHFCVDNSNRKANKKYTAEDIFKENSTYKKSALKFKLVKLGYKEWKCERCERTKWEGEQIPLEVHHVNGINTDNRLENLQLLCPNCHAITDNYCGKNIKRENTLPVKHKVKICKYCGKEFIGRGDYCSSKCVQNSKLDTLKEARLKANPDANLEYPTKEWLEEAIKIKSFCDIAREYGVTDNAVRRWCKKYGLPSTKTELGLYNSTPIPKQICRVCGKEYKPQNRYSVCCSFECAKKWNKLKFILDKNGNPIISKEDLLNIWNKYHTKADLYRKFNIKRNVLDSLCEYYNIKLEK